MLVCICLSCRFSTSLPKETCTTRSCCVRPPGCLPSSLQHLLNWRTDLSHMGQRVGSRKDRMLLRAFTICIAVCRREVLFPFQLRDVLISSSFIRYQETEANRFHHFRSLFFSFPLPLSILFAVCFPSPNNAALLGDPVVCHPVILTNTLVFAPQLLIFWTLLA